MSDPPADTFPSDSEREGAEGSHGPSKTRDRLAAALTLLALLAAAARLHVVAVAIAIPAMWLLRETP